MERASRTLGVLHDVDRAPLGEVPHGLGLMRQERGLGAEQALVPRSRRLVVAHGDPGKEVRRHEPIVARRGYHAPLRGEVAQLVEHTTENRGVPGSIPGLAICRLRGIAWLCPRSLVCRAHFAHCVLARRAARSADGEAFGLGSLGSLDLTRESPPARSPARPGVGSRPAPRVGCSFRRERARSSPTRLRSAPRQPWPRRTSLRERGARRHPRSSSGDSAAVQHRGRRRGRPILHRATQGRVPGSLSATVRCRIASGARGWTWTRQSARR